MSKMEAKELETIKVIARRVMGWVVQQETEEKFHLATEDSEVTYCVGWDPWCQFAGREFRPTYYANDTLRAIRRMEQDGYEISVNFKAGVCCTTINKDDTVQAIIISNKFAESVSKAMVYTIDREKAEEIYGTKC